MSNINVEEKQTHITMWKESGLSKMDYCKQAGISSNFELSFGLLWYSFPFHILKTFLPCLIAASWV
ncbi:MAG: IS66 family insertion sequence element accessory protein TnpA [Flavobacteriales bacterium]